MTVIVEFDAVPGLVGRASGAVTLLEITDERVRDLAARVRVAYAARLEIYKQRLDDALELQARGGSTRESGFPELALRLDETDLILPIDESLYTSLLDLYVFYGSAGLGVAEAAIRAQDGKHQDLVWAAARSFFHFTRNAVVLIVRETMIGLEAAVASRVFDRLGQVSRRVADALAGLRFKIIPARRETRLESDAPVKIPERYELVDRAIAKTLFDGVTQAVRVRDAYAKLLKQRREIESEVERAERAAQFSERPRENLTRAIDKRLKSDADLTAALAKLHDAQRQLHVNTPFALLVSPGLPLGFETKDMEDGLLAALRAVSSSVDKIAAGTRPGGSRVVADLRGPRDSNPTSPLDLREIEEIYLVGIEMEKDLVGIAMGRIDDDPRYVSLLHTDTWNDLIRDGTIARDTFEYVVAFHWLTAIETAKSEAARRKAWLGSTLGFASSALSLLSFVIPPLVPLAFAADLALVAFAAYSAISQLADLDEHVQRNLPALASGEYETLAAAGELAAETDAFRNAITLEILTQVAILPLQRIRGAGTLMRAYFYANDVTRLVGAA